jgi:hypothetical protein
VKHRVLLVTAALAAAVAVYAPLSLPPRQLVLTGRPDAGLIAGVLHVHSSRSDGRGTPAEVAAAAKRAGLDFIVLTDHGDGTRKPDPPTYIDDVLILDGVEISTSGGHYLALGMEQAPYKLAGEARDVVEDVRRLGGFGVVAHPDSPSSELRWRAWNVPFDGLELLNLDTSWRVHVHEPGFGPKLRLVDGLITYPFRAPETIASLSRVSEEVQRQWESLTDERRVVALAGSDAHAKLSLADTEPGDNSFSLPFPAYETIFRTLSLRVRLPQPLTRNAASDGTMLLQALRDGHAHVVIDAIASPAVFTFTATGAEGTVGEGDELVTAGPVSFTVRSNAPHGFTTRLLQGDIVVAESHGHDLGYGALPGSPSAAYRAEIRAGDGVDAPIWVAGNPIYLRRTPAPAAGAAIWKPVESKPLFDGRAAERWRDEHDPTSQTAMDVAPALSGVELRLRYGLAGGSAGEQFAALVVETPEGVAPYDRVRFTARAERPLRISVQARAAVTPQEDERWQRSVYIDTANGERTVHFEDMMPVGTTRTPVPPRERIHSIVFAIELTNSRPGTSGRLWITRAELQR